MTEGIKTFVHPVGDLARAKALYGALPGVEPYADEAYYVGFRVGDQEFGLDPNGHRRGLTGPVGYWHVEDINRSFEVLLDAGAQALEKVKESAAASWSPP